MDNLPPLIAPRDARGRVVCIAAVMAREGICGHPAAAYVRASQASSSRTDLWLPLCRRHLTSWQRGGRWPTAMGLGHETAQRGSR